MFLNVNILTIQYKKFPNFLKMSVLKQRRDMPVDLVYEDSFYANLLLGLPKILGITNMRLNSC